MEGAWGGVEIKLCILSELSVSTFGEYLLLSLFVFHLEQIRHEQIILITMNAYFIVPRLLISIPSIVNIKFTLNTCLFFLKTSTCIFFWIVFTFQISLRYIVAVYIASVAVSWGSVGASSY